MLEIIVEEIDVNSRSCLAARLFGVLIAFSGRVDKIQVLEVCVLSLYLKWAFYNHLIVWESNKIFGMPGGVLLLNKSIFGLSLLLLTSLLISPMQAQSAAEVYKAVTFDRHNGALAYPTDTRLDLADAGSIEIGITIPDFPGNFFPQIVTLVSHEGIAGTAFRLQIGARGTKIGLFDGEEGKSLPYDFRKGGFYQIGISVRNGKSEVFINGSNIGTLENGFGNGREMPLYIGGQGDQQDTFTGKIHYFRLWNSDLTRADYAKTYSIFGKPDKLVQLSKSLVAYSQFTDKRRDVVYSKKWKQDDFLVASFAGKVKGEFYGLPVPEDSRLVGVETSGADRVRSLTLVVENSNGDTHQISASGTGKPEDDDPPCIQKPCPIFAHISVGQGMRLLDNQSVIGVTLTTDGKMLKNIQFHFNDGTSSAKMGSKIDGNIAIRQDIPKGTRFAGITGFVGKQVELVSLAYRVPIPFNDISGRWVATESRLPSKVASKIIRFRGGSGLHGNYSDQLVVMLTATKGGRNLQFATSQGHTLNLALSSGDGIFRHSRGQLEFIDDSNFILDGVSYSKVKSYPQISAKDQSFNEFGGTFNLDLQIPFTAHMFKGHDIGYIDPQNLQDPTALRKSLFKVPGATSREFFPSYQKVIPFGLLHYPDSREKSRSVTQGITSAQDYSSKMSQSIGVNIGIPKVGSFGLNSSVNDMKEDQSGSKTQFTATRDIRTQRALVMDKRHMELDLYFKNRILDLARSGKAGKPINYSGLISEFGTHYSYAMTIGTVSVKTIQFSSNSFKELYGRGKSIGVNASATVKKVKFGGKYSKDSSYSNSFNKEMENQTEEFDEAGSELQPVPVFLDLRLLSELLVAPFFDDPYVRDVMRPNLAAAIKKYTTGFASNKQRPQDIWEPYFFKVAIESAKYSVDKNAKLNGNSVVGDDASYFYGSFSILGPGKGERTTLANLLKGRGASVSRRYRLGARGEKQFMVTASQMCGLEGNFGQTVLAGARIFLDYSSSGDGSNVERAGFAASPIHFKDLGINKKTYTVRVSSKKTLPNGVDLTIRAWRLPDIDGGYKEMPICK